MMKIIITSILIFSSIMSYSQSKIRIKVTGIYLKKISPNSYLVETGVEYSGLTKEFFEDNYLHIPNEDKIITGKITNGKIKEKNFLYSNLDIDLNNDNDFDDVYKFNFHKGKYYFDKIPIEMILSRNLYNRLQIMSYYDDNKNLKTYRTSTSGKPFTIYQYDDTKKNLTIGIGTKINPIKLLILPNPSIQVMIIKIIDNIKKKPQYSISSEKNYISYSNEPVFENQGDDWTSIVWIVKKIMINDTKKANYSFKIINIEPPFAVISIVNMSIEKGLRLRSIPYIRMEK